MIKYKNYFIALLIFVIIGFVFYKKVYLPKTTYEKFTPIQGDLQVRIFGIGNLGAKDIYDITAQTGGRILKLHTDEGKWVKKGELLVEIDPVDIPNLIEQARIGIQKAQSEANATKKELQSLQAQKKLASVTYKRYERLQKASFASKAEYDKAKADLSSLTAQIAATKAHIVSAKLEIKRTQESLQALQTKLSRYHIYSPIDGYVISKTAQRQQTILPSQPIFKIVDPKTVWIKTYIDEKISGTIKIGQQATIMLRSHPEHKFSGVVKRVVAQSDPVTLEREVDVAFRKLPIPFYVNEQAEVFINTHKYHNVLKIPAKLLTYNQTKTGVWVKKGDKAHFEEVKVIAHGDKEIAVDGIDKKTILLSATPQNKPLKEGLKVH